MKGTIRTAQNEPTSKINLYLDPTTKQIVASYDVINPARDITSLDQIYNWPVYSLNTHFEAQKLAQKGDADEDSLYHAFLDSETESLAQQYKDDCISGGEARFAALRSERNSTVNIINVWTELQGRRDRKYAAKALAREIPTKNLVISVDKVTKFGGMTKLDEGQLGQLKQLSYSRQTFTASKYGLKFVIHEEARLKNVHNVLQDSILIAGNKVDQRASFDVISAATGLDSQPVFAAWDTFVASTSRSTGHPLDDIGIVELNIEGTAVGGKFSKIGMHQLTEAAYLRNSDIRGIAPTNPQKYDFEPGVGTLPGLDGIGLVKDQGIQQGIAYCVDTETEDATIHYYQGPQRLGSAHDEETGDDKYFIIDYHLAQLVQAQTGFQLTGINNPLAW
jgi:hypothetical protein